MDETLIHCNEGKNVPSDVKIPIKLPQGGVMEVNNMKSTSANLNRLE